MSPIESGSPVGGNDELARARALVASQALKDPALVQRRPWVSAHSTGELAVTIEFEQFGRQWHLVSDESRERGGSELGPSPMRYVLAGLSSCLLGWIAKVADERERHCDIESLTIRTMLDMRGENAIADVPPHPQWFVLDLTFADEQSSHEQSIIREAIARCPISALVAASAPLYVLSRQGERIITDDRPEPIRLADNEDVTR